MFDTVIIDRELLPITDEEYNNIDLQTGYNPPLHKGFQSKCFENELTFIRVTSTHLQIWKFDTLWEGTDYTEINHRWELYLYEGDFNFYSLTKDKGWIEFDAEYIDGKLSISVSK